MKKTLIIFVLLLLPLISSIQTEMPNYDLKQGETLITKISGNFLQPILKDNIYFYRGFVAVPFEFELLKIEQEYYIYTSTLGKTPGNYSIVIENSEYSVAGGQTSSEEIAINFSLQNLADFSTNPGLQILENSQDSFSLEIQNLKDEQITVYIDTNPSAEQESQGFFSSLFNKDKELTGQPFTFKTGETKQVILEFGNLTEQGLRTVQLSSNNFTQNIFVYVLYSSKEIVLNETNQTEINRTEINQTGINETQSLENVTDELPTITKTCEELEGAICEKGQKCSADQITAKDGVCCLGECVEKKKSKAGQIIGWTIVIILVALYAWFYLRKYRKVKKKVDLLKVAEGKKK